MKNDLFLIARLWLVFLCLSLMFPNAFAMLDVAHNSDAIELKRINPPVYDGIVNATEWADATFLDFNFTFANGQSYRANVYMGHNLTHFWIGVIIFNVGPNPFSVPNKFFFPDGFFIHFDVDNDGKLTQPEDSRGLLDNIGIYNNEVYMAFAVSQDFFWDAEAYPPLVKEWHERRPEVNGDILLDSDQNLETGPDSCDGRGYYTHGFNGDEHFEFFFPLSTNSTLTDGLQLKENEEKTVGFTLEYYRQGLALENGTRKPDLYDYWPGEGFSPNVIITPSGYAKLHIDLRASGNDFPYIPLIAGIALVSVVVILAISHRRKFKPTSAVK